MRYTYTLLFWSISLISISQEQIISNSANEYKQKGEFYFFWGWNRAIYSHSDINFRGDNYNFTIYDVMAKDRPTPFNLDPYFNPLKITIPQTNMRIGYYLKNDLQLSLGVDHMKYVMQQNQLVKIDGNIAVNSIYDASYSDTSIVLTDHFLTFEHTDGLNYINFELRKELFLASVKIKDFPIGLFLHYGGGVGLLMPKTNTSLLNFERYDEFHVAGFGASITTALQICFGKHFFIQSDTKGGYINMPDIRTTKSKSDRASQHFLFLQGNVLIGWRFNLSRA